MSKKKRRNWWYGTEYDDDPRSSEVKPSLFSNTINQHNKRMGKEVFIEDEDSFESPYANEWDWGLNRKLNEGSREEGKKSYDYARDEFKSYQTKNSGYGGAWLGYEHYKKQQLSYKYVQQMANGLAAQYKITVKTGNSWKVDLKKKELTYNPGALVYGTKSELLATLMHEIGKLRYGTHPDSIKNKYLTVYKMPAVETLSIFEDIRVDYLMLQAYDGAGEIYEAAIPAVDKKIDEYRLVSAKVKQIIIGELRNLFQKTIGSTDKEKVKIDLNKIFGENDQTLILEKIENIRKEYDSSGTIFDYCGEMLRVMYDSNSPETVFDNIIEKVKNTESVIPKVKKQQSTQDNANLLDSGMFPFVEDLLRDFTKDNEKIQNAFQNMTQTVAEHIQKQIESSIDEISKQGRVNTDRDGNSSVRSSGPTDNVIPSEWKNGEYGPLKESVMPEIKQLVSKLTFLRREEMAQKSEGEQRRGKLNAKKLYKSATGNRRVFKRLLPNIDTVQSFAFSIVVDTSGSMSGSRMVHTTRALIIFAEVFKKMDIPFEVITFSNNSAIIKKFEDTVDKTIEKRIGGLPTSASGGSNMDSALAKTKIRNQPEKNKVMVMLSDGGVGSISQLDRDYFIPMSKEGIVSVGFGIECEPSMSNLCMGNSKVLENANTLPIEFSNLLKSLIKKKK